MRSAGAGARRDAYQPPDAPLSRGLEVHPGARPTSSRSGSTATTSRPATSWSFPAATRCASGSARSTPATTSRSRPSRWPPTSTRRRPLPGQLDPQQLRPATEGGIFFAGDSAGHCLPLTAEGSAPRSTSGSPAGASCRGCSRAARPRDTALRRYAAFSAGHEWQFQWMLRVQRIVPRVPPRLLAAALRWPLSRALRALVVRPLPADRATPRSRARASPRDRALAAAPNRGARAVGAAGESGSTTRHHVDDRARRRCRAPPHVDSQSGSPSETPPITRKKSQRTTIPRAISRSSQIGATARVIAAESRHGAPSSVEERLCAL